ncbi:MAG TPA: efflux RND transporter permease subunit, partial [Vicinamibacterales bacterium]|nr:efflux RND transporter permease subunit [Vicinamibacterales bacterium]
MAEPQSFDAPPHQHWFARHAKSLIFLIVVLAVTGSYLAFTIPIAVFPSTSFPRVIIGIDNGVMPINQMLVTITRPVEEAVNSVQGLQQVRSITSRGSAEVDLFFDWSQDMVVTLQRVNAALAQIQASLPPTAQFQTHRLMFSSFPVIGYSLTSKTESLSQLWELATYTVKPRLNRLDGVSTIRIMGGQPPEFQITPRPGDLLRTGITVPDLLNAVGQANLIDSPGLLERDHQLFLGLVSGQVITPLGLAGLAVKNGPSGVPIHIGDVASVTRSQEPVYTIVTADTRPAVLLEIRRQPGSNTVTVADEVHQEVRALRRSLPADVHIEPYYDQSEIVTASIKSVRDAVLLGIILASIILVLFLHDWGSSLVAGLVIPVTLTATFIALKVLGQSFNLMTLGGLAAAVGLVIDDAIVVVENVVLHRDAGQGRFEAVKRALDELTIPLIGSTITPIVVFLPLIAITGVTGVFFRALAVTMGVALLTSLALALTWTPTLSQFFIRRHEATHETPPARTREEELQHMLAAEEASMRGFFGRVIRRYEVWLRRALAHPWWLAAFSVLLIVLSFFSYRALGSDLLPSMDEGGFVIDYIMPAGSSLSETNRVVNHVEQMIRQIPEVESTSRRTGLQLGLAAVTEANTGDISVKLKADRSRGIDEIISQVRSEVAQKEPELSVDFTQVLQDMIGDLTSAPQPVVIKLFSEDTAQLMDLAPKVADRIGRIHGVVDLLNGIDNTISGPAVTFQVNPTVAAQAGFTPQEVSTDAGAILLGDVAPTPVITNDRAYAIRVRFPAANRASLEAMRNTLLVSSTGRTATLGSLATVSEVPGQTEILRQNLQQEVEVTARFEGIDLGTGMAQVQAAINGMHLPPSVRVEYGGTYQEQQKSFHDLVVVLILALVLVFAVLLIEFGSFAAPTAILASALLSTAGVFFALLVTNTTFNVASFMGLIMVVGIVAKNGILLLDADHKFRVLGMGPEEAMIQAGRRRLRPITMTALAAVAGMAPLAFAIGSGSQMLQPLAVAVIGGILISMVLSLIVTPLVYYWLSPPEPPLGE